MVMWILPIFLLVFSIRCSLQKCSWTESSKHINDFSYYLKYPASGACQYSINKISGDDKTVLEMLLFLNDLDINNKTQLILNCTLNKNEFIGECSKTSISFLPHQKNKKFNIKLKWFKNKQNQLSNIIQIKFYKYVQFSDILSTSLETNNQLLKVITIKKLNHLNTPSKQESKISKYLQIILASIKYITIPIIFYILLTKKHTMHAYSFIQQMILFQIIKISIQNEHYSFNFLSEVNVNFSSMLFYWGSFIINFVSIMLSFKVLLQYIEKGPIQLKNQPFINNRQVYGQSIMVQQVQPINLETKKNLQFSSSVLQYFSKFGNWYKSQRGCIQRLILLLSVLAWEIVSYYGYQVINNVLQILIFGILPVYISFKNITCASQIQASHTDLQKCQDLAHRDICLFPIIKINLYFLIKLYLMISKYDYQSIKSLRMSFQIIVISIIWILTFKFIKIMVDDKMGKKVKIYQLSFKNRFLQKTNKNSIFDRILRKKSIQQTLQIQQQTNCCICLQQINVNQQNNKEIASKKCVETQCGHIFHGKCFSQWTNNKMICPVDRNMLNRDVVKKIIDKIQVYE